MWYGSRSNAKTQTVKINGSVAIAVKNGTVKKSENGTVRKRWKIWTPYWKKDKKVEFYGFGLSYEAMKQIISNEAFDKKLWLPSNM